MKNSCELVGYYGGDLTHSQAAWCSTGGETEKKRERMPALLKMLADSSHGTPFERSLLHFRATVDTATHIHILKHRHFSVNGESARYKEYVNDKLYEPHDWPQGAKNELWAVGTKAFHRYHSYIKQLTDEGLDRKRAKESARYVLPYAIQIDLDFSCNFRAFIHFQKLRNSEHAQLEVREVAQKMLYLVKNHTNDDFKHSLEAHGY